MLGAILVQISAYDAIQLKPEHFFSRHHQVLFAGIQTLLEAKTPVDYVTLKDEMARRGELAEVGGPAYIAGLGDGVPQGMNCKHYAAIVKEKATLRAIIETANQLSKAAYEASEDASAILSRADRTFLDLQNGHAHSGLVDVRQSYKRLYTDLEDRQAHRGGLRGVTTGFQSLDDLTLGWRPGWLVVIAARPSVGKSLMVQASAIAAAKTGKRVAFFSLEMRRGELEDRLLSSLAQVDHMRIQSGHLGQADSAKLIEAFETIRELPILVLDKPGQTALDVRTACRRAHADGGLGLIVVDYVQLMGSSLDRKNANQNEIITDISKRLKDVAGELQTPVLLVSQLKRIEGRPKLDDLRESGSLEQAADVVGLLHRKDHRVDGNTEFLLVKSRNGPTGSVNLTINRSTVSLFDGGVEEPEATPEPRRTPKHYRRERSFVGEEG